MKKSTVTCSVQRTGKTEVKFNDLIQNQANKGLMKPTLVRHGWVKTKEGCSNRQTNPTRRKQEPKVRNRQVQVTGTTETEASET